MNSGNYLNVQSVIVFIIIIIIIIIEMTVSEPPTSTEVADSLPNTTGSNEQPVEPVSAEKRSPEDIAKDVLDSHEARLFHAPPKPVNIRDIQLPDSFFDLTPAEMMQISRTYAQNVHRMQDTTMKTSKMRKEEEEQRMRKFRKVLIRLQLPDRRILQGVFTPQTTIRQIIRFVRAALLDARNVKFHLFVVPPKRVLSKMEATLWNEGLVPAALVHIGIDTGPLQSQNLLKPSLLTEITSIPEAFIEQSTEIVHDSGTNDSVETQSSDQLKNKSQKDKHRKIPKWFKK